SARVCRRAQGDGGHNACRSQAVLLACHDGRRGARLARNVALVCRLTGPHRARQRPWHFRLCQVVARRTCLCPRAASNRHAARVITQHSHTMYVLYEDSGNFKAEKIFSESDSTLQVESESGKRSKIKKNNVLFRFDQPAGSTLLEQAQTMAETLEIDFLWECAPQEEFDAAEFAEAYFGHPPTAVEQAALIFSLNSAPAYFHRRGKGRYRPAPPEILQAALAAIEKKRLQAAQQQEWTDQMVAGHLP